MDKPSQEDFDTAREVLEFMLESTKEHTPYAVNTISDLESILEGTAFQEEDYE